MEKDVENGQMSVSWSGNFDLSSWSNPLTDISPGSKILACLMVTLYVLGQIAPIFVDIFALVPGYTFPPHLYLWNVVTCSFFNVSIFTLLLAVAIVVVAGKFLEALWGTTEYIKFVLLTTTVASLCMVLAFFIGYYATYNEDYLFPPIVAQKGVAQGQPATGRYGYMGFHGGYGAFSVALKQLAADVVPVTALPFFRGQHLPLYVLSLEVLCSCFGIVPIFHVVEVFLAMAAAWVYLRWFQNREGVVGDASDEFSFANFFPQAMQPAMARLAGLCGLLCCCQSPKSSLTSKSNASYLSQLPVLSSNPQEAEKRRQIALEALEERLRQMDKLPTASKPNSTENV